MAGEIKKFQDVSGTQHTIDMDGVEGLDTALAGKAASSHTHTISEVTNLQTSLDGKAATSHTHTISEVTNLQTTLAGKAASSHTHTQADITDLAPIVCEYSGTAINVEQLFRSGDSSLRLVLKNNNNNVKISDVFTTTSLGLLLPYEDGDVKYLKSGYYMGEAYLFTYSGVQKIVLNMTGEMQ